MSSQELTPLGGTAAQTLSDASTGSSGHPGWADPVVRERHRSLADRIIALANPKTTLDLGCGPGLLVQALAEKGVDARGLDTSEDVLAAAHPEVRERLDVHDWGKPLPGRYDLVTCLEVLERVDAATAQSVVDAVCASSDRVLFAASDEQLVLDGHPTWEWAAAFAERGFYRRTDLNLGFISAEAVLFERTALQPRDIVHRYEALMAPLAAELRERRMLLARLQRERSGHDRAAELEGQLRQAQHDVLTTRDHIIGLEAENLQLQLQATRLDARLTTQQERTQKLRTRLANQQRRARRAERKLDQVRRSRAWRIARRLSRKSPEL